MLREECDKIYKGRCSCKGGVMNEPGQEHWCTTQTDQVRVVDTYHLPAGTTGFYWADNSINLQSRSFMDQIKGGEKCTLTFKMDKQADGSKIVTVNMLWPLESDFLPSWIWMIESGYNKQRDEHNSKYNIKFSKQVTTKTANFTISAGPYTTNTPYSPYHVESVK